MEFLAEGRERGGGGGASCFSKSLTLFQTKTVMVFTPVFMHGGLEIMTSFLGLEHEQNRNLNRYFSLSLLLVYSLKPYPIPYQNGQSLLPFSDQTGAKTLPFGAARIRGYHTGARARDNREPTAIPTKEVSCKSSFLFSFSALKKPEEG